MWFDEALNGQLSALADSDRLRRLRPVSVPGVRLKLADGRVLIDASSNDYLGLSQHPAVKAGAARWTERFGAGTRASRLVTGTLEAVLALEGKLARFKNKESALMLGSGFLANATILPALFALAGTDRSIVLTDRLNHASLHHGCQAAGVRQIRFRHNDLDHLEHLLRRHAGRAGTFIVTETVFSMDGDRSDVCALVGLAARYEAVLYVDEAHATGVLGPQGRGLAASAQYEGLLVMGTLGKALGSAGAYIAGPRRLIDYLINRCAGFVYSTALPPAAYGAADAALDLVPGLERPREELQRRADRLRLALHDRGIDTLASSTQIVPAVVGSEQAALDAQRRLEAAGVLAVAIRPPTVPQGASRLRFSLSAALSDEDFDQVLASVATLP